jgi:hypothetical protein
VDDQLRKDPQTAEEAERLQDFFGSVVPDGDEPYDHDAYPCYDQHWLGADPAHPQQAALTERMRELGLLRIANGRWPPCRACVVAVRVAVHQPAPDRTQAVWLDLAPDLSSTNSTQAYCVDVEHQPTDLALWGSGAREVAAGYRPSRSRIFRVSRSSMYGSSSGGWPAAMARLRSSSAFSSAPSRIAVLDSHSHTRKMITLARLP